METKINWGYSRYYDNGHNPKVTANRNRLVVEVHKSEEDNRLWYHVGQIKQTDGIINWGPSIYYDEGQSPSVSINDNGVVVEVHNLENPDVDFANWLYYDDRWSALLQYISHLRRQTNAQDLFIAQLEQKLQGTFGFRQLPPEKKLFSETRLEGMLKAFL